MSSSKIHDQSTARTSPTRAQIEAAEAKAGEINTQSTATPLLQQQRLRRQAIALLTLHLLKPGKSEGGSRNCHNAAKRTDAAAAVAVLSS
jgi:hypothetical protein